MTDEEKKIKIGKLAMWRKRRVELDQEYKDAIERKGAAAREGDLSENYAYKDAIESAELALARQQDVDKIITDLEKELGVKSRKAA